MPSFQEARALEFFNLPLQKLLTKSEKAKGREITEQNIIEFNEMTTYLVYNKVLSEYIHRRQKGYIVGYYLLKYHSVEPKKVKPHNPLKTKLKK